MVINEGNKRNNSIDILKGITCVLMILAHTIYSSQIFVNSQIQLLLEFINLTSFTVFLFLSGVGTYLSYLRNDLSKEEFELKKPNIIHKLLKLLFSYYLISLIGYLPQLLDSNTDIFIKIIRMILFIDIPSYVEFLIPFIVFYLITYFFRNYLKTISNSFLLTLSLGFALYLLGDSVYRYIEFPSELVFIKSILFGYEDWYRFPIFQYASVFLFGIYWGKLINYKNQKLEDKLQFNLSLGLVIFSSFLIVLNYSNELFNVNRWPPSILFILLGLSYSTILLNIFESLVKYRFKIIEYIGRNLFDFYILHLVFLYLGEYVFNIKLENSLQLIFYYIIVLLLCLFSVYISNSHKILNPIRKKFSLKTFDSLYFKLFYIFILISLGLIFLIRFINSYDNSSINVISEIKVDENYVKRINDNFTIDILIDRKNIFIIDSDDSSFDKYKSAIVDIKVNNKGYDYKGVEILINGVVTEKFNRNNVEQYNYRINPKEYNVGTHRIEARIVGSNKKSEAIDFIVSYPLYVLWTIDWEGYDISNSNLNAMENISSKYQIPMVQLVNPRTFIASDINNDRKDYLKEFVIKRYQLGDEIGLHLHMHYDLFKSCGLNYRTSPKWDDRYNGHDVLTSAYTQEEFGALINCSLNYFKEYDFPIPYTYRAGGWFIDLKNLKVLTEYGFKVDTSGRDKYSWGKAEGFWDLSTDQSPYLISSYDQNIEDLNDNFGLIEVPNNGRDTTNNPPEVMIEKFDEVYKYKTIPLEKMNIVNFMSHPHWFTKYDNPTMIKVMDYVSKYRADNDSGPVIFTTIERIYNFRNPYD